MKPGSATQHKRKSDICRPVTKVQTSSYNVFASAQGALGTIQGSHIGYSRVEEIIGEYGNDIGKQVYIFENTPGGTGSLWDTENGTLMETQTYDNQNRLVKKVKNNYSFKKGLNCPGGCNGGSGTEIRSPTTCDFSYSYQPGNDNRAQLCKLASGGYEWRVTTYSGYTESCTETAIFKAKFIRKGYLIEEVWKKLESNETWDYFYDSGAQQQVYNKTNFEYTDNQIGQPTAIYFTNSDGKVYRTEVEYYKGLNIKTIPKKVTKKTDGTIVGGTNQDLDSYGRTSKIYEILEGGTELQRVTINSYQQGRPIDYTFMDHQTDNFLWDHGLMIRHTKGSWIREYDYFENRQLKSVKEIDGLQTNFDYDKLLRLKEVNARSGNIVTTYSYQYGGPNQIQEQTVYSDAPTQTMVREFDGLGRPTKEIHNGVVKHQYFYDSFGRMDKETYLPGNFTEYLFDDSPLNRIIRQVFPDYSQTQTLYLADGNYYRVTTKDEKGNPTSADTDLLGRQSKIINAIGGTTVFTYVSTLQYPVQIHLVRLCDGSTAYILDQFLGDLEGSHLTIGSITVTSPDQLFNVTAVQPEPIFAMAFNHEANGNISRAEWQTTFHRSQFYDYAYDPLNRLLSAQYGEVVPSYAVVGGAFQKFVYQINNNYNENNLTYDGDGNIKTLQRMGLSDANNCASKVQIDNLLYTLIPGTPRLQKVADSAPAANRAKGFNPGASPGSDYVYDQNGNLITDPYKGLTIQYNFLNLPKQITKGGSSITIRYDVTGRKWSQAGPEGIREYIGGIEYLDQKIQSIQHSEGRLVPTYSGTSIESIRAEYWRQDHLGNTRIAFSDFNLDGVIATKDDPNTTEDDIEITQENHYYPFGLNQEGPWYQTVQPKNKHQYNGKELIEDLGLNWNDYGARWYDPALGRWNMMDPLAGEFYAWSPFSYVYNNPIIFVDPFGLAGNLTDGATFYLQKGDITDDEFWSAVLNYVSNVINVWGIENEQNLSKVSFKFVDESFSADQLTGNENLVSFGTGDKVSNVSGKNNEIGFINIKDISDGNTPAHEFGHHLGLSDRYFDGVTWNQSSGELGRKTDPISGEEIPDNAYNPDDNLYSTQTSTLTLYQIAIAHTTAIEADYQQNRGYFYSVRKSGEVIYKEGYRVVDGVGGGNARVKGGRELSRKGSTNEKIKEEIITQKRY